MNIKSRFINDFKKNYLLPYSSKKRKFNFMKYEYNCLKNKINLVLNLKNIIIDKIYSFKNFGKQC